MKTISATKFKARCPALLSEVQTKQEIVVITKRDKPVAKLVPVRGNERDEIFGFFKGQVKVLGDIVSPAFTPEEWGDLPLIRLNA